MTQIEYLFGSRRSNRIAVVGAVVVLVVLAAGVAWAINRPETYTPTWDRHSVSPDGRTVGLHYAGGSCDDHAEVEVDESADRVVLTISVTETGAEFCTSEAISRTVDAHLDAPLGDRELVDGAA